MQFHGEQITSQTSIMMLTLRRAHAVFIRVATILSDVPESLSTTGTRIESGITRRSRMTGILLGKLVNGTLTATGLSLQYSWRAIQLSIRAVNTWWNVFKQPTAVDSLIEVKHQSEQVEIMNQSPPEDTPLSSPRNIPGLASNTHQKSTGENTNGSDQNQPSDHQQSSHSR